MFDPIASCSGIFPCTFPNVSPIVTPLIRTAPELHFFPTFLSFFFINLDSAPDSDLDLKTRKGREREPVQGDGTSCSERFTVGTGESDLCRGASRAWEELREGRRWEGEGLCGHVDRRSAFGLRFPFSSVSSRDRNSALSGYASAI